VDAENVIGLVLAILAGFFLLWCLYRPEDL
jgi:hypothetical protein